MNLEKIKEKVLEKEEFFNQVIKKLEKDLKPIAQLYCLAFYKDLNHDLLEVLIKTPDKELTFNLPINFIWTQFLKDKDKLLYDIDDKLELDKNFD